MSNLQRREDESSKDVVSLVLHAPELLPRARMQPASGGSNQDGLVTTHAWCLQMQWHVY